MKTMDLHHGLPVLFSTLSIAASVNMVAISRFGAIPRFGVDVVHSFFGGADGAVSSAALAQWPGGKLHGTTAFGASSASGVGFRLPASAPGDFDGDGKADMTVLHRT
jgi:hypothetical protein